MMEDYKFKLSFSLPGYLTDAEQRIDSADLSAKGISVSIGTQSFCCQASCSGESAMRVIRDTINHIHELLPEASLKNVAPDLLSEPAVIKLLKTDLVSFRSLIRNNKNRFPEAHADKHWHLKDILEWLRDHCERPVNEAMYELAKATHSLNIQTKKGIIPARQHGYQLPEKYRARSFEKATYDAKIYR